MIFMGYESNKACENREKEMTPRGVKLARGKCAGIDSIQILMNRSFHV
jgi:hypothetical protein